jgi:DNA-binding MarR family transcriptional regulator
MSTMITEDVGRVLQLYPRVFLACHTRHVRDAKAGRVLSAHQASILDHLDEIEPTGLLALAKHLGVTASTMSLTVDRLARGGYVRRDADPRDGRRVGLRLTKAGVRIKREKSVLDPERVGAMLRRLSKDERAQGIAGLALLAQAASEELASRGAGRRGGRINARGQLT